MELFLILVCLIAPPALSLSIKSKLNPRIVQTRYGEVQGITRSFEYPKFLKSIDVYLGIPYATPPVGSNRFSPTRAPSPWEGVRALCAFSNEFVIKARVHAPGSSPPSRVSVLIEHGGAYSKRNFDRSVRCNARTISDFLCRLSDSVGPVCPQKLPDIANEQEALERMPKGRLEYLKRLLPHLRNQSEDCLYLNIYAPAMGE
ncbi:hypothetical protein DMN91_007040 [Ooceraea biroi]|uniref:Carboxylesterase type B domain-containing protein n=1 Tax=Ooceraea biroi TaxID=2015173 RepID=A0A3L8DJ11_OOCBI|nr:hypothetical protein DMN91_007040 [Ooceraea biroi]